MAERVLTPIAATILAIGIGVGLWSVGQGIQQRYDEGITVSGSATIDATADRAAWSITVTKQGDSVAVATQGLLRDVDVLTAFLRDGGLTDEQITVGGITTSPIWGNEGITGQFQASSLLRVRSDDVQLIADLNRSISKVLTGDSGITIENMAPEYYVSNLAELRPQVQELAVQDARNRAQVMVEALDGTLGDVTSVTTGSVQVIVPDSVDSEYGAYDLSTIDKSIRAVVSVSFDIR